MGFDASHQPEISAVVPAFNEEARIRRTLSSLVLQLEQLSDSFEILVVDDGSQDQTVAAALSLDLPSIRLVRLPANRGKGEAVRQGIMAAKGLYIYLVDADLPYRLDFFVASLQLLRESRADAVIGARDLPASESDPDYPRSRVVAGKTFSRFVNWFLPLGIADTQCGFKGFRSDLLRAAIAFTTQRNYVIDIEILLLLKLWGARIERLPVHLINHHGSKVRLVRDSLKMLASLMSVFRHLKRGRYPASPSSLSLVPVPCPVCSDSTAWPYLGPQSPRFCRCRNCGTLYQNPRPSDGELDNLYGSDYYETGELESGYTEYFSNLTEQRATAFWIWREIEETTGRRVSRVLDVGCGSGEFLRVGIEQGRECWGIDLVPPREDFGIRFTEGSFLSGELPTGYFDLVVFNDSFEHFVRPREVLIRSARLLRDRGVIAVNTPNAESWVARLSGRGWISMKAEHFVLYPRSVLVGLMAESGFREAQSTGSWQLVTWRYLEPRLRKASALVATMVGWGHRFLPQHFWVPTSGVLLIAEKRSGVEKSV